MRHNTETRRIEARKANDNPFSHLPGETWQDGLGDWHYVGNAKREVSDYPYIPLGAICAVVFFLVVVLGVAWVALRVALPIL